VRRAVRQARLRRRPSITRSPKADAYETLNLIEAEGAPALLCKANVADAAQVTEMVAAAEATFDRLDVLVNNAATTHFVPHTDLDALTDQVWQDIIGTNVMGAFYCTRAAMPLLQATKGNVVNVTSVAGLTGQEVRSLRGEQGRVELHDAIAGPRVRAGRAGERVAPGPILTRWLEGREAQIAKFLGTGSARSRRHPRRHRRRGRVPRDGHYAHDGSGAGSGRRPHDVVGVTNPASCPEWGDRLRVFRH